MNSSAAGIATVDGDGDAGSSGITASACQLGIGVGIHASYERRDAQESHRGGAAGAGTRIAISEMLKDMNPGIKEY